MKKLLLMISILLVFTSCNQVNKNVDTPPRSDEVTSNNLINKASTIYDTLRTNKLELNYSELLGDTLIGMVIDEEQNSSDPYLRYLLDISSVCYASDLGIFEIKEAMIILRDFWGEEEEKVIQISEVIEHNNEIKLAGEGLTFIILKIEDAPIYYLKIEGDLETDLKINEYFTTKSKLENFEIHDCGDFQG